MSERRWLVACHESGHCIATLVLNGECEGAIITSGNGGLALCNLHGDRHAFMTAAGQAAEPLATTYEPPAGDWIEPEVVAASKVTEGTRDFRTVCSFADMGEVTRTAKSDSEVLAEWAISNRFDDPDSWSRRVRFAKHVAAEIVKQNEAAIVRVARELYTAGRLSGQRIMELFEQEPNQ